jgi:hypothetical protein
MRIANILSKRLVEKHPSYHIIYEWEDELAACLKVPVINATPLLRKLVINRYSKKIAGFFSDNAFNWLNNKVENFSAASKAAKSLVFELYVSTEPSFTTSPKAVLAAFYRTYADCEQVLVSSLEALRYLQTQNCPLNLAHFPLSLSDIYKLKAETKYVKEYDILFAGRANVVLMDFMQQFVVKYPETEFLQQQEIGGELHYVSNKRGVIGKFHSRADYMNLLRASKISFYSTPGIDGGEKRTGGFNPVTPRYLELLSAQCLLLGKYPTNEETTFYELDKVCPNVDSFESFERLMLGYLHETNASFDQHRAVLDKHYTSLRAQELTSLLAHK